MLLCVSIDDRDPRIVSVKLEYHLRGVALANQLMMEAEDFPPLYQSGVRYLVDPDSARTQRVLNCAEVLEAGKADCKSLACYQLGWYWRHAPSPAAAAGYALVVSWKDYDHDPLGVGLQPVDGICRVFHIEISKPNGSLEDPSSRVPRA